MVGLEGLGARPISALSGGQKQRVAIARALALKPLDAALRDQMQIEVKRIQRSLGVTTVFVTHDQREAMALADRIVVMNGGKVEQAGAPDEIYARPPDEIYARPRTRFVAEFIGTNNIFDVDVTPEGVVLDRTNLGPTDGTLRTLKGAQTLAIRPEAIALSATKGTLQGALISQRRLGAVLEREIDVQGRSIFQSSFVGQGPDLADGVDVFLSWDWNAAWVLAE